MVSGGRGGLRPLPYAAAGPGERPRARRFGVGRLLGPVRPVAAAAAATAVLVFPRATSGYVREWERLALPGWEQAGLSVRGSSGMLRGCFLKAEPERNPCWACNGLPDFASPLERQKGFVLFC